MVSFPPLPLIVLPGFVPPQSIVSLLMFAPAAIS